MRNLFDIVAAPIKARFETHDKIMKAFEYVNRAHVVTLLDFEDCFTTEENLPYGDLGITFRVNIEDIRDALSILGQTKKIGAYYLPQGLANTHTRDVVEKHHYSKHADLPSYHLGDLLDQTDLHIKLSSEINRAVIFGDGQHVLDIVKRMQRLPDYSQHFPHRTPPPDNGETKKKREKSPGWVPVGQLQPTRL